MFKGINIDFDPDLPSCIHHESCFQKKTSAASANIIYSGFLPFKIQFTQNNNKKNSNKLRKPDDNKKRKKQTNSKRTCLLQFSCSLVVFDCCFISDVLPISRRMLFEYSRFWCANDGI